MELPYSTIMLLSPATFFCKWHTAYYHRHVCNNRFSGIRLAAIGIFVMYMSLFSSTPSVTIAIDASGSMTGYYRSRGIQSLVQKLTRSIEREITPQIFLFKDTHLLPYNKAIRSYALHRFAFGQKTLLSQIYDSIQSRMPSITILLTDNIQSSQDPYNTVEEKSTNEFYRKLSGPTVRRTHLIPVSMMYNGYLNNHYYSWKNTDKVQKKVHTERFLPMYCILHDTCSRPLYDKLLTRISQAEPLLIRPITKAELMVLGIADTERSSMATRIDSIFSHCPELADSTSIMFTPNASISGNGILAPMQPNKQIYFSFDRRNQILFNFKFRSALSHITIKDTAQCCCKGIPLTIEHFSMTADNFDLTPKEASTSSIYPAFLVEELSSDLSNQFYYCVDIRFGPYPVAWNRITDYLKWDFAQFKLCPIPLKVSFEVVLRVLPRYLKLSSPFSDTYFTSDQSDYKRIYTPEDIIQSLNNDTVTIRLEIQSE